MKKNISTLIAIAEAENNEYIANDQTVADYLLNELENNPNDIYYYFDESELGENDEPSKEALEELKEYISDNYNYYCADFDRASETFDANLSSLGMPGEHAIDAYEYLGLKCPLKDDEWCDLYIDKGGHRVAVYGNTSVLGQGLFFYKNLD